MPPLRRWVQFLTIAGSMVGMGYLFVEYGTPSDEQFVDQLSPELKSRYYREKELRERMDKLTQKKIEENRDKPAWLQGSMAMRKLDREIATEALKDWENEQQREISEAQRKYLKELADKEKKL